MASYIQLNGKRIIDRHLLYRNDWAENTKSISRSAVNNFLTWLDDQPLTPTTVQQFSDYCGRTYSGGTGEKIVKHVGWFCEWLHKDGWIKINVAEGLKRPRILPVKRKGFYTPDEYIRLRDCAPPDMRTFVIIAFHTGMSSSDVAELKWSDVDLNGMMIIRSRKKMRTRGESIQYIPILTDTDLHDELVRLRAVAPKAPPDAPVCAGLYAIRRISKSKSYRGHGIGVASDMLGAQLHQVAIDAGVEWKGTHAFRRGLCTTLVNDENANVIQISHLTGHASADALKDYVTPQPHKIKKSLEPLLRAHFAQVRKPKTP